MGPVFKGLVWRTEDKYSKLVENNNKKIIVYQWSNIYLALISKCKPQLLWTLKIICSGKGFVDAEMFHLCHIFADKE